MRTKQNQRILKYMHEHDAITQIEALNECGVMRLASRISELKMEGYPIKSKMVPVTNRFGESCYIAQYSLEAE